jgi:mono/diheme cytochrome c family protein
MTKLIRVRAGLAVMIAILAHTAFAQNSSLVENVDHAGIISHWDQKSLRRGQGLFQIACAPCHGMTGVKTINPQARPFAVEKFQNGGDPYSMFKTITRGFKNMPSQTWMTPEQRYEVIQFIREAFVKKLNPTQYTKVDQAYLDSLPRFDPVLARSAAGSNVQQCDFGPVLESQLGTNFSDVLTFQLKDNVSLSYDLHHMCLAGAWQGGFLDLSRTGHSQQRGEGQPLPNGKPLMGLREWYWAFGGRFDYPTNDLLPRGPLPSNWMKFQGHYVYNRQAVLSFTIEGRQVLEWPNAEESNNLLVVSHTLRIGPGFTRMRLCVGQSNSAAAGALGMTEGLTWESDDHQRLILNIPPDDKPRIVRICCASRSGESALDRFGQFLNERKLEPVVDPETLTHGGARLWPLEIKVHGALGDQSGAYALDTIPVPFANPYGAWLRTSALAFFPDGRAVVTTYGGDVWIVSGLDHSLENATWSRFASGLYEPFGAQVINGMIYVTCRNGIVRLHDLNNDGEADFYETWYADTDVSTFFHSFSFDLQVDHGGHLYYAKAGEYTDYKLPGAVIDVMPDGSSAQVYCTGFRVPNGMGILPDDRLTVSDNQGDWMPASKINIVHRGGFYGYVQNLTGGATYGDHWAPDGGRIDTGNVKPPATFDQPIIWMPQEFDNSSSAQLWVDDQRFGPLSGRLLHSSFGKGWIYYLMLQDVGPVSQAAIVALPFQFDAGLMRIKLNPADGQVYATGLSGWQGPSEGKDGCLQRLRYTGKPIKLLDDVKVRADGLSLRFNFALDRAAAVNPANYHLEQWNYLWSSNYGSDQYSVEHPGQKGHDRLAITSVKLSEDGREALLTIPGLRPVNQVEIRLALTAADGTPWKELAYLTINAIPEH